MFYQNILSLVLIRVVFLLQTNHTLILFNCKDKDIYLLDDPLAAVDAHVAVHLFQHCIMGLLKHKTRILCTHHTKFLAAAHQVLIMENGTMVYYGTPDKVLGNDSFLRQYSGRQNFSSRRS